jgi:hypothetical protein
LLSAARLTGPSVAAVLRGGGAMVALGWLPLLVAALAEGRGSGWGGFLMDFGVHARMAVAVPFLLFGERAVERRLGRAVGYLGRAGLIDEGNRGAALAAAVKARRLRDAAWPEVLFVLLVIAGSAIQGSLHQGAPWMREAEGGRLSAAGLLYFSLSLPLYRFLLLRWLGHLALWTLFLARLARAPIHLQPAHPDRMGGLAPVAGAHQSFGWVVFALGVSLSGYLTTASRLGHRPVTDYTYEVCVFAVLAPLFFLLPLFVFAPSLEQLRRRMDDEYGASAAAFARRYRDRWLRPGSEPMPLDAADPSSHTDLSTSFDRAVEVRRIPFRKLDALFLFGCAAAPMLAFLVQGMPLVEIFENLRKILG